MRKASKFSLAAVLLVLFGMQTALAEVTWKQVKDKINGAKSYTVNYKYDGPSGKFKFDYRFAGGGDKIRTEIKSSKSDPSKKGTVIVYDKGWNGDRIRAKTGGGMIVRNLSHKDVKGRPFHQSIFKMILNQTAKLGKPTVSDGGGGKTKFVFKGSNGKYTVLANAAGEIVETSRKDGKSAESRKFSGHAWNGSPKMGF